MSAKILIVDDEDLFREDLALVLSKKGYILRTASSAEEGITLAKEFTPDIILSDIVMPGKSGIELLEELQRVLPDSVIIIMTAFGTMDTAIEAFRKGAVDYIIKPLMIEDVLKKIERILEFKRLQNEIHTLRKEIQEDVETLSLVGQSEAMQRVLQLIKRVAPTNSTVLITGESGTGKELVARAIHEYSPFREAPFLAVNCSGFQENLLESELFGHVKGAFTGAIKDKEGFFQAAGEGTIFLDEISEMPLSLQAKLLRVLEEKEFYPVGGTNLIPLKARVVAATNRDLKELVEKGEFREDLFYRIAVFEINLPSLRERRSDIPLLAEHFIRKFNKEMKTHYKGISPEALEALISYHWPGNVRELRNVIERAMILCDGHMITSEGLPASMISSKEEAPPAATENLKQAVHAFESTFIRKILDECKWNKEEAARRMGINPSTLYRKMNELNIEKDSADS